MKRVFLFLVFSCVLAGCNDASTMDRIKAAESKRSSRQVKVSESQEIKRLREENRRLSAQSVVATDPNPQPTSSTPQSSVNKPEPGIPPTAFPEDPSKGPSRIGVESYKRTYTNAELVDMAANAAELMIPPLERFDNSRPPQKIYVAKKSQIKIDWSEKDQLYWATVPIVYKRPRNAPGTPSEPPKWIAYLRQMNSDGYFEWFRHSIVTP